MTQQQIDELAALQKNLSEREFNDSQRQGPPTTLFDDEDNTTRIIPREVSGQLQIDLDKQVERILNIPDYIRIAVHDFIQIRYQFIKGKRGEDAVDEPSPQHLLEYGRTLAQELDAFVDLAERKHKITLAKIENVIVCQVEYVDSGTPVEPTVVQANQATAAPYQAVWQSLKQPFSQWVYVQRSLRWFDGETVWLYKPARLMDWTPMQAQLDSDDIIGEILSSGRERK